MPISSKDNAPESFPDQELASPAAHEAVAGEYREDIDDYPSTPTGNGPEVVASVEESPLSQGDGGADDIENNPGFTKTNRRPSNGLDYSSTRGPSSGRMVDTTESSSSSMLPPRNRSAAGAFPVNGLSDDEDVPIDRGASHVLLDENEKVADVHQAMSQKQPPAKRRSKVYCLGIGALILVIAVVIGLGVGLGLSKSKSSVEEELAASSTTTAPSPSPSSASLQPSIVGKEWFQKGQDVDGHSAFGEFGQSVSLSGDGSTLGVASTAFDDNPAYIQTFRLQNSNWTQVGETFYQNDTSLVALSFDGSRLIISTGQTSILGQVQAYDWNGASWTELGKPITGESSTFGIYASISVDGFVVAVTDLGASSADGTMTQVGRVHMFIWNEAENEWTPHGQTLYGDNTDDLLGSSVSLNFDGSVVAVGASQSSDNGYARIYELSSGGQEPNWLQRGQDLSYSSGVDFGSSISLSHDGNVVAVGDDSLRRPLGERRGTVHIFGYDGTSKWSQRGETIRGEWRDILGFSVSINGDGTIVAAGAPRSSLRDDFGYVTILYWIHGAWSDLGNSLAAEKDEGEDFGYSVSISADGRVLAAGDPYNKGVAPDAGSARVFQLF